MLSSRALLPLQPGQLRFAGRPTCRSPPPGTRPPTTPAPRPMCTPTSDRNNFSAGLYSFYSARERSLRHCVDQRRLRGPRVPNTTATQNAGLVEFYFSDQLQPRPLRHALGGMRISSYHARSQRNRRLSPHRRNPRNSASALGLPRLLRPLLPARAGPDRLLLAAQLRVTAPERRKHLYAAALRARRRTPVRRPDSLAGLAARHQQLQEPRQQLPRPRQRRRVEHVLPHRRRRRSGPRMGADDPLTAARARRPVPSRLLQPDRRAARQHHRRIHLQRSRNDACLQPRPRLHARRSRSAPHAQHRLHREAAPAHLVRDQCLLRIGFTNGLAGAERRPLQRALSARAHHLRCFRRPQLRRELEGLRQRHQRHQSPHPAGQLHHHRRLPLQRSPHDLRRSAVPLSLLKCGGFAVSQQAIFIGVPMTVYVPGRSRAGSPLGPIQRRDDAVSKLGSTFVDDLGSATQLR